MSKAPVAATRFRESVRRLSLFRDREPLLVAVSGGIDSVSLLHLILHLPERERPPVTVAHFNHRLRGRQSDEEARFVQKLCTAWKVPFREGKAPPWRALNNLEARARDLRYRFLKQTAARLGISTIVTAHQADDQAETFLIRWLQGAGLKGLSGILPLREREGFRFIRPLLQVSRGEIQAYASFHRLDYRNDPTNEGDRFLRGRIRKVLKGLGRENPRLTATAAMNALLLQEDELFLEHLTESLFHRLAERQGDRLQVSLKGYLLIPRALRWRLIQRMAADLIGPSAALPSAAVLKIDELLQQKDPMGCLDLPKGLRLEKKYVVFSLRLGHPGLRKASNG